MLMHKHYLKQAFRRIIKDRSYSLLNMLGLAAGLACFTFIALWVNDELSYDQFNLNYDRITRLVEIKKTETGVEASA
jgi:putative ABC transport system permease protein